MGKVKRACWAAALALSMVVTAAARAAARPVTGLASWYGKQHHGKKMTNGQRFNRHAFTAAHRKYKFGTLLRVCFVKTDKCTQVEVTDRGPVKRSRKIDLSEAAAKAIGLKPYGVGRVTIEEIN